MNDLSLWYAWCNLSQPAKQTAESYQLTTLKKQGDWWEIWRWLSFVVKTLIFLAWTWKLNVDGGSTGRSGRFYRIFHCGLLNHHRWMTKQSDFELNPNARRLIYSVFKDSSMLTFLIGLKLTTFMWGFDSVFKFSEAYCFYLTRSDLMRLLLHKADLLAFSLFAAVNWNVCHTTNFKNYKVAIVFAKKVLLLYSLSNIFCMKTSEILKGNQKPFHV